MTSSKPAHQLQQQTFWKRFTWYCGHNVVCSESGHESLAGMSSEQQQPSVAVIGLGGQGLVTVKNLLEQGFRVTGFDRNDYVGGIWHYSAENHLSVLPSTVVNVSRERACFTDFEFPNGTDSYPTSTQVDQYLNNYADAFHLRPHLSLSTSVHAVQRDDANDCWQVTVSDKTSSKTRCLTFDKVVMANGPHNKPSLPQLPGQTMYKGDILHSIAFKNPQKFQNKRVLVLGVGNTAADTATSLVGIAQEVYLSHRDGAVVLPRLLKNGKSLDHGLSYRQYQIKDALDTVAPRMSMYFLDTFVDNIQKSEFGKFDPKWRFQPTPSLLHQNPTVTDTLIPALRTGTIRSTHGIRRITGDFSVELEDGTALNIDTICCCTGYGLDYSVLGDNDPTLDEGAHSDTPRLYKNIFSLRYPDSLAFVGIALLIFPAFLLSDLTTMAIAQLWSSRPCSPSLPSQMEMERDFSEHLTWVESVRALSPRRKLVKYSVRSRSWLPWVTKMGGCDLDDHLGYFTLESWKLWWSDRQTYKLLANGVWSPHVYRLFEPSRPGGRKKWGGAQQAIIRVNKDVNEGQERRKRERARLETNVMP
jgi:dimethylaniline monooxygenase (N-oxide forming)